MEVNLDGTPDAVVVVDSEGRIVECNAQSEVLFGYSSTELTGRAVDELVPERLRERHRHHRDAYHAGPTRQRVAFRTRRLAARRKDGTEFTAEITLVPSGAASDSAVVAIIRDLTEVVAAEVSQRAAEQALRASEERFARFFDANPAPTLVTTVAESKIINLNAAFTALSGFTREELLGREVPETALFFDPAERTALLQRVRREGHARNVDIRFNRKSGPPGNALVSIEAIEVDGQPCLVGTVHDVTEKRRQEAIRKIEFDVTRILSESATLKDAGPALLRALVSGLGWDYGDILLVDEASLHCGFECAWHDQSPGMRQFEDFSKAGVSLESDEAARHLITDRSPFWVGDLRGFTERAQRAFENGLHSAVAVPFVSASRAVGALSLFSRNPRPAEPDLLSILAHIGSEIGQFVARSRAQADLEAERKALAQKVDERTAELSRANEELERTGKMKDEFLASMSHELRTPISAILGLSEFLQQGIHGPLNEKQARSLKTIEESGRHLLALVDDILDISKIEAGKVRLEPLPVWAEPVCSGALRFVSQAAQRKHLSAKYVVEPPSLKLRADEKRLRQILVNLLSNAVKFTPEGGEIGIEAMEDEAAGAVIFRVWDTGIGIAREDLPRLFQPFTQLDSRLSRQHAGAGLGLSLVKKLVDLHGGSVGIESERGHGTRVTVSLPKGMSGLIPLPGRDAPEADGFLALTAPDGTGQIILLAEDNEAIAETASRFLELRGYRVVHATDGGDAVAKAIEFKPSLVLMDVHMPRMDGLEATRRIRQALEVRQVPIVAVTALVMPGDRERCLEAGCDEYLAKPLGLKTLAAVVRRFVSGQHGA